MSLLEEFVLTWDPPAPEVRRRSDAVYARAGWRCTAPGCTSRRNLEDHHLVHRSRGGVATCLVSVPNRYMHSPNEVIELADLEATARLVAAVARNLDAVPTSV